MASYSIAVIEKEGFIDMSFFEQFGVTPKQMGKIRSKFVSKVEKELGKFLSFRSAIIPIIAESEKRSGLGKLRGKTQAEQIKYRFLLFSAEVRDHSFRNIVGFLSPIPLQRDIFFEEFTYFTLLPGRIDSVAVYVEKKGGLGGKKGFYSLDLPVNEVEITEEMLFESSGEKSTAFNLAVAFQKIRMDEGVRQRVDHSIKTRQQSTICIKLNEVQDLHSRIKQFTALSEARKGNIRVRDKLGITTILVPMGDKTIVQVGDFQLKPKRAIYALELLASTLKSLI